MMMSFNIIGAIAAGIQSPWMIAGSTQRIASQTFAGKRGSPLMMLSFTIIGVIRMELRMIAEMTEGIHAQKSQGVAGGIR